MSTEKSPKKKNENKQTQAKETYEPPKLMKFEKLEKLIVSGE
ncbi:MAG: hypothetical protein AAF614_04350 [Chloroflexota bacterium]